METSHSLSILILALCCHSDCRLVLVTCVEDTVAQSAGALYLTASASTTDFKSWSLKSRALEQKMHRFSLGQVLTPQLISCDKDHMRTMRMGKQFPGKEEQWGKADYNIDVPYTTPPFPLFFDLGWIA